MRHKPFLPALALLGLLGVSTRPAAPPPKVVVLTIDVNNIHKSVPDSALAGRTHV